MKSRLLLTAFCLSLLTPAAAAAGGRAALWVPSGETGAGDVISALENDPSLRLTAAFGFLPKDLAGRVRKLREEGRLELARRPAGDPPLPLLYYPGAPEVRWEGKPERVPEAEAGAYFLSLRFGMARDEAAAAFGRAPEGLVSVPGGLAADYFPLGAALGVKWIACGPFSSTAAAVMVSGGVRAVPFVEFSTGAAAYADPAFLLFDETSARDPQAVRAQLLEALGRHGAQGWLTVSGALEYAASTAAAPSEIAALASPWGGDYSRWASAPLQAGALAALARTRKDLMLFLNSEQGDFLKAEPAFRAYFSAEDGPALRVLASTDSAEEADLGLRNTLADVYRLMGKPPPQWIFSSLSNSAPARSDKPEVSVLPGGFEILNAARPAAPPKETPGLPASADPAAVWKLAAMRVSDRPEGTLFGFKPAALDNAAKGAAGFSHVRIDLYMDVNHRPRAGLLRPLEGRPLRLFPENAWEYALEVSPDGAVLHKIAPGGKEQAGRFPASVEDGWITVLVPGPSLKGTPERWGYAALMLAPGESGYTVTDYIAESVAGGYIYALRPDKK